MKIVTGYVGRAHITSQDLQRLNRGIVGPDMYVLGVGNEFSAELTDSTTVTISDGDGVIQGCQFRIDSGETENVVMADGESGRFRNDLIVARYTKVPETGVEDVSLVVLRGASQETDYTQVLPDYMEGDIDEGDTVDFPLYRVHFSGFTIDDIIPLFTIIPSVDALYQMQERLMDLFDTQIGDADMGTDEATVTGAIAEINRFKKSYKYTSGSVTVGTDLTELQKITVPANNTGKTIIYRVSGACVWGAMAQWAAKHMNFWRGDTRSNMMQKLFTTPVNQSTIHTTFNYFYVEPGTASWDIFLMAKVDSGTVGISQRWMFLEPIAMY